jgi:hypothetical protein
MSVRSVSILAAGTVVAAGAWVLPAGPAAAATCSSSGGVSVVVDFSKLGGGIAGTCVAGGGGDSAGSLFEQDHDLTRVARFPGAVCKVDATPADMQCQNMPADDAYWGLFWSDGSGGWVYSSEGVDSLDVPDGGSVAFAWQDGGGRDLPGIAPPQNAAQPSSPPTSSGGGHSGGSGGGSGGTPDGASAVPSSAAPTASSSTTSPSAGPTARPGRSQAAQPGGKTGRTHDRKPGVTVSARGSSADASASASAGPSDDPSEAVPVAAEPSADVADGGLPTWVAPALIAVLFGVGGLIAVVRRRRGAA